MAKKVLIVTKDIGEFNVFEPVARTLIKWGVPITLVAEGLSLQKWQQAGYSLCPEGEYADIEAFLRLEAPDLVLTGLGAPINLGEKFGLAANRLGVKLGYVHDLWGVYKRSLAVPDFVCVTDEYDVELVRSYPAYVGKSPKVYITGSPAMDILRRVERAPRVTGMVATSHSILMLGQDESTTPMLEGLVEVINRVDNCVLIPRFHPKFMGNDELRHKWLSLLYGVKRGMVLFVGPEVSTRELMKTVGWTVSVYSTGLIEASILGSKPVSWVSSVGRQKMKESLGVERFPFVETGYAVEVSETSQLVELIHRGISLPHLLNDGRNTERVVTAVMKELGG